MKLVAAALIVLAAVGALIAVAASDSTVGTAVAIALVGCAAVGGVALAFFAIGDSEDRERAEQAPPEPPPADRHAPETPPADPHPPRTLGLGPDRRARRPPRRPD